jgi:hypothetical protein
MKYLVTLAVGLLLVGCAARELKVDCDGKLQPINAPAPATHPGKVSP